MSALNAGDPGSIHGSGGSPREGNGNPLQYSCLENPMDRGAWWATDHGAAKESDATKKIIIIKRQKTQIPIRRNTDLQSRHLPRACLRHRPPKSKHS